MSENLKAMTALDEEIEQQHPGWMDGSKAYAATPAETLEQHIMDCRIAKSEAEHWAAREIETLRAQNAALMAERDATGWLIEENAGGFIHWIALSNEGWPKTKSRFRSKRGRSDGFEIDEYITPVTRVKDANEALRFARKADAEAFMTMFDRFLLCPKATEHQWGASMADTTAFNRGLEEAAKVLVPMLEEAKRGSEMACLQTWRKSYAGGAEALEIALKAIRALKSDSKEIK